MNKLEEVHSDLKRLVPNVISETKPAFLREGVWVLYACLKGGVALRLEYSSEGFGLLFRQGWQELWEPTPDEVFATEEYNRMIARVVAILLPE